MKRNAHLLPLLANQKRNAPGFRRDSGSRDQEEMGLDSQALRDQPGIGTGMSGGRERIERAGNRERSWRGERVDRRNKSLRGIRIGAHLHGFAGRRSVPGFLVDGDFDGSFAARRIAGVERCRVHLVLIATTDVVHYRLHHVARKDRLSLQGPEGYQQEQQDAQRCSVSPFHCLTMIPQYVGFPLYKIQAAVEYTRPALRPGPRT
jgi:hypothetical protein